jgi:hypothetical protein
MRRMYPPVLQDSKAAYRSGSEIAARNYESVTNNVYFVPDMYENEFDL